MNKFQMIVLQKLKGAIKKSKEGTWITERKLSIRNTDIRELQDKENYGKQKKKLK